MNATPNSLFVFPETGAQVRVVQIDGNPWFVAADAVRALGMDAARGTGKWIDHLATAEVRRVSRKDLPHLFWGSAAPTQTLISESGLYKFIMRSNKPLARKFQDWVTRDVLPAIRKDGAYVRGEEMLKPGVVETLDLDDLDALRDRIESLLQRKGAQRAVVTLSTIAQGATVLASCAHPQLSATQSFSRLYHRDPPIPQHDATAYRAVN